MLIKKGEFYHRYSILPTSGFVDEELVPAHTMFVDTLEIRVLLENLSILLSSETQNSRNSKLKACNLKICLGTSYDISVLSFHNSFTTQSQFVCSSVTIYKNVAR